MISEKKTLIVLDTNALRSTLEGEVTYCSFEFGDPYNRLESFILDNGLSDLVRIAVPRIVIGELEKQKSRKYLADIEALSQIYSRLSLMPHIKPSNVKLPKRDFDCKSHINQLTERYLTEKRIQIIEIPSGGRLKGFFERIMERALERQPPFRASQKYSDVGFKDALIWESILSFERIKAFNKIILLTGDTGLNNPECKKEFENKIKRFLSIQQSADFVVEELNSDYAERIRYNDFVIFAHTDYFESYLQGQLSGKKHVLKDGKKYPISRFETLNPCESVETDEEYVEQEPEAEGEIVNSTIKAYLKRRRGETSIIVKARTHIDENRNINRIDFDPELTD